MTEPVEVVETPAAFAALLDRIHHEPIVGLDTEAASFHRYRDRVYLLQVSSPTHTAVVDPLAVGGLPGLGELLAESSIEFVFHDADYDLRLLYHEYGYRVAHLFDTRVAAQFAGESSIGLAAVLLSRFGVTTDKRFQRADWSARPLSPAMIAYAATDTRYLVALRDSLRSDLERLGRLAWVEEECTLLTQVEWAPPQPPEEAFLRFKGARTLGRRGLAVLRELFTWREREAERLDRATFRILGNEPLLAMAAEPPDSLDSLARIRGVGRDLQARRGSELLAAIRRGLDLPESELPRFERGVRPRPDPAFDLRLERLKAVRTELAATYLLPPGLLCPNATLEAIARRMPAGPAELEAVPGVRRWQVNTFGDRLLGAISGA